MLAYANTVSLNTAQMYLVIEAICSVSFNAVKSQFSCLLPAAMIAIIGPIIGKTIILTFFPEKQLYDH